MNEFKCDAQLEWDYFIRLLYCIIKLMQFRRTVNSNKNSTTASINLMKGFGIRKYNILKISMKKCKIMIKK